MPWQLSLMTRMNALHTTILDVLINLTKEKGAQFSNMEIMIVIDFTILLCINFTLYVITNLNLVN